MSATETSEVTDILEKKLLELQARFDEMEILIRRVLPREGLAPPEVWAKLGKEGVVQSCLSGAIQGVLANVNISTFRSEKLRRSLITDILDITDGILMQAMERMNQVPREVNATTTKSKK